MNKVIVTLVVGAAASYVVFKTSKTYAYIVGGIAAGLALYFWKRG